MKSLKIKSMLIAGLLLLPLIASADPMSDMTVTIYNHSNYGIYVQNYLFNPIQTGYIGPGQFQQFRVDKRAYSKPHQYQAQWDTLVNGESAVSLGSGWCTVNVNTDPIITVNGNCSDPTVVTNGDSAYVVCAPDSVPSCSN